MTSTTDTPMRYLRGIFTPTGAIVCPVCFNADESIAKRARTVEPIAHVPDPDECPGTCDHCGAVVLLPDDLSLEQAVVRDLQYHGLDASMAQTGGMNSAAELALPDGSTLYATASEDEPGKLAVYRYRVEWPTDARLAEWYAAECREPLGWLELAPDDEWGPDEDLTMQAASALMRRAHAAAHWQGTRWGAPDPVVAWDDLAEALWALRSAGLLWNLLEDPLALEADVPNSLRPALADYATHVVQVDAHRDEYQSARFRALVEWAVSTIGTEVF